MVSEHHVLDRLRSLLDEMFPAERKVAEFILNYPEKVTQINITDLAEQSGTSDATVIRMCKRLGCKGFYQLKLQLSSELGFIQLLGQTQQADGALSFSEIFRMIARSVIEMEQNINTELLEQAAEVVLNSRRIYVLAAGNSIPTAMDLTYRLSRLGIRSTCSTIIESILNDLALGSADETLIVISHSGASKPVLAGMELARNRGMKTILFTRSCRSDAELMSDYCIPTRPVTPLFYDFGMESHLFDNIAIDLLLYLILSRTKRAETEDAVEMFLSDFKS